MPLSTTAVCARGSPATSDAAATDACGPNSACATLVVAAAHAPSTPPPSPNPKSVARLMGVCSGRRSSTAVRLWVNSKVHARSSGPRVATTCASNETYLEPKSVVRDLSRDATPDWSRQGRNLSQG